MMMQLFIIKAFPQFRPISTEATLDTQWHPMTPTGGNGGRSNLTPNDTHGVMRVLVYTVEEGDSLYQFEALFPLSRIGTGSDHW